MLITLGIDSQVYTETDLDGVCETVPSSQAYEIPLTPPPYAVTEALQDHQLGSERATWDYEALSQDEEDMKTVRTSQSPVEMEITEEWVRRIAANRAALNRR